MTEQQPLSDVATTAYPGVKEARNLFLLTLALVVVIGSVAQHFHLWAGLVLTEALLILAPVLLFIRKKNHSYVRVLRLRRRALTTPVIIGLVLGVLVWPVGVWIQVHLREILYSSGGNVVTSLDEIRNSNMVYRFLVMGILASFCEEFLFRGYIQTALEKSLGAGKSIVWTTILFAVFHLDPATILALLPLSFLLTWICWKFDSIVPAIALHFSNNFLAAYIFSSASIADVSAFYYALAGCTALLLMLGVFLHNKYEVARN